MIFLDTNAAIAAINDAPRIVADRIAEYGRSGRRAGISSIALFELRYGVAKSARRERNEERLRHFLAGPVDVQTFDEIDAAHAGELRARLKAARTPIGPYDTLIAGQALRHGATLVTANGREFGKVHGLIWEDWSRP